MKPLYRATVKCFSLSKASRSLVSGSRDLNDNLSVLCARSYSRRSPSDGHLSKPKYVYATILATGGIVTSLVAYKRLQAHSHDNKENISINHNEQITRNRGRTESSIDVDQVFSRKQVAEHNSLDKGVWISYKGNVYDITNFVQHHPGGSHTILMGAGGDVEPFWQTYTVHHANEVQGLLSQYKIGILSDEDQKATQEQNSEENNPYVSDPLRNPLLQVHTKQPFNAETPGKLLQSTYITPTDIFFVRNHLPVPEVDPEDYNLSICIGSDGDPDNLRVLGKFTLDDLKTKFKPHSIDCVIQCSGNRRSDLKKLKEIKGLDWGVGAIGNAHWTGVRFVDLLDHLKLRPPSENSDFRMEDIKHVQLEGLDSDMSGQSYGASVSADIALDPNKDIILAYEMNGKPLTRDHGYPIRFIAPGVTGARNVKWLSKIILSHEESHSHWQRKDYKSFSPNVDMFNLDFQKSVSIQETPVQSAICYPEHGDSIMIARDELSRGYSIPVSGYAYSGGGRMVIRVDVSIDGGSNWMTADLRDVPKDSQGMPDYTLRNKTYSWTRWSIDIPLSADLIADGGQLDIVCRAFDSAYNSQPERPETVWNVRGVVNNSWHKITLNLKVSD